MIIAASCGSSTACVPTSWAITPPRSMSPTRITGISAARAKPMLAMSFARRFTSAGLPAPSTITRSAPAGKPVEAFQHRGHELRLERGIVARLRAAPAPALHDDLRAGLGFGLQQDRVHVGHAARARQASACKRLRAPDLAPVDGDGGIVRHVLRLEGARPSGPRRDSARQRPATSSDLPTFEPAPWIIRAGMQEPACNERFFCEKSSLRRGYFGRDEGASGR